MEKSATKKHAFGAAPWIMKDIDKKKNFMLVTSLNRPTVVTLGRILYYIRSVGKTHTYAGYMTIDPCFTKGWWKYPFMPWDNKPPGKTHWNVSFSEDMDYDDWAKMNKFFINRAIESQILYFKPSDPILVYFKE